MPMLLLWSLSALLPVQSSLHLDPWPHGAVCIVAVSKHGDSCSAVCNHDVSFACKTTPRGCSTLWRIGGAHDDTSRISLDLHGGCEWYLSGCEVDDIYSDPGRY